MIRWLRNGFLDSLRFCNVSTNIRTCSNAFIPHFADMKHVTGYDCLNWQGRMWIVLEPVLCHFASFIRYCSNTEWCKVCWHVSCTAWVYISTGTETSLGEPEALSACCSFVYYSESTGIKPKNDFFFVRWGNQRVFWKLPGRRRLLDRKELTGTCWDRENGTKSKFIMQIHVGIIEPAFAQLHVKMVAN